MIREKALKQVKDWYKTKLEYEKLEELNLPEGFSEEEIIQGLSNYTGTIIKLIKDYNIKEEEYVIHNN